MGEGRPRAAPVLSRIAGGEMAERVRAFDWSQTPVGPRDAWSPSLRLAVDMILATNFPMALRWGPELVLIYNDAYTPALHERHPEALGARLDQTSPDFQASIRAFHEDILNGTSGGFAFEKLPLKVTRGGAQETGYFTISYSPVPDASAPNGVGGVLVTAVEVSQSVADQKTLKTTQERYEMARDASGVVGAWEWDIKANKVYADARYAELHNVSPEFAAAGLPVQSYTPAVHPDDRERVRDSALKATQEGGDFSHEYRLVQADGSIRWVYTRGRAYLDEDGQPARNTGVVVDITERKQVEAELAAARIDLDLAAQAAGMGRWDHKPHIGQRFWDARARSIFGLSPDEKPTQEAFERLLHPDDLSRVRAAVAAAMDPSGDGAINLEYRIRRGGDGALRWVEVFGRAFFDGGQCVRFVGVASDVTERREAVDRLLRQEQTLRLAMDAADVGTWQLDLDTGDLTWSDRCYQLFGLQPGEPVDLETAYALIHPADEPQVREATERAIDPNVRADYAIEYRAIGRDDHVERWLSVKGKVFFGDDGKSRRFVGAVVNVTDRKRAELHLRLLVNELNHRVKNSLATIQAIATQSFNGQRPLDQAQEAFSSRIVALAEAHDLLTRENWEGAELHDVTARVAALHGGPGRFDLSGPSIRLSPKSALSLSMALHELATNAMKYGALSTPVGRVHVSWALAPDPGAARVDLTWTETGGPPVAPPTERGFGSRLIERGLAAELSGSAAIDFHPDGVVCRIRALTEA
ncbi:PAS domain-containing protein [Caulobacter sp. 602-1]|uniref:PAS domain-containing protein n=1 Tax=unclassified Caulobacter TaxID=2648921 RepID=UPI000F62CB03|nr:PAS domain-containing protein [Caulobacter sp. 602-1]RRN65023.1 PAS domain S-box protein [Caulobacter sp. 602-1]